MPWAFRLSADDPERDDLTRQAQALLTRYEFAWRGNLRSLGAHEEPTRAPSLAEKWVTASANPGSVPVQYAAGPCRVR